MLTFFNICFGVGLVLAVLNAILSLFGSFEFMHFDFDFDLGGINFGSFLPMSPSLMIIFITVFGGTGKIMYSHMNPVIVLIIALIPAFAVTYIINRFLIRPLRMLSSKESAGEDDIIGLNAVVSEKIFEDDFGKITFRFDDNTISGPAKSSDKSEIPAGAQVVILERKNKVYIVERLS